MKSFLVTRHEDRVDCASVVLHIGTQRVVAADSARKTYNWPFTMIFFWKVDFQISSSVLEDEKFDYPSRRKSLGITNWKDQSITF